MKNKHRIEGIEKLLFIILLVLSLAVYACGGGGGGSSSGIAYNGITTQATITDDNATEVTTGAYLGGVIGTSVGIIGSVQETKTNHPPLLFLLTRTLEKSIRRIDMHAPPSVVESGTVSTESGTEQGSCGGSATYSYRADDVTGEVSGTYTFNNYCEDGVILDGSTGFSATVDLSTDELTDYASTFDRFSVTIEDDSFTIDGDVTYFFPSSTSFTATIEMRIRDGASGDVLWLNNYEMSFTEGDSYDQLSVSGRYYDPDYGYVNLSTSSTTPLRFYSGYYPSQGVMFCAGKNSAARFTALSSTTFKVEADTDGDGSYDDWASGTLEW